jgi:D-glycero-alpha-D-manno-heptose 1-phosphate guanylyltransferase
MEIKRSVKAIILAGGFGTRIKTEVDEQDRPKPLLDAGGRPFITFILDQLIDSGFDEVIISIGYMANRWKTILGDDYGSLKITYVVEDSPLGTGGAIKKAIGADMLADSYLIMNGDTYIENADFSQLIGESAELSIYGTKATSENRYGTIIVDEDLNIVEFEEKVHVPNDGAYINAGVYKFDKDEIVDHFSSYPESFSLERDFLPKLCKITDIKFVELQNANFIDIGTIKSYNYFRNIQQ